MGFYDEMLHEHFKQKLLTKIAKEKRKRNNVFQTWEKFIKNLCMRMVIYSGSVKNYESKNKKT